MNRKLIVFDVSIPPFKNNRILDPDYASKFPGTSVITCLHNIARKAGWDMMTADVFLSERPDFKRAVCLSNEVNNHGLKPVALPLRATPVRLRRITSSTG